MNRIPSILLAMLVGCSGARSEESTTPAPAAGETMSRSDVTAASNRLTADLYRTIADPTHNGAASPLSVLTAFAMAREGARGETRSELDRTLHLDGSAGPGIGAIAERIDELNASGVTLRTANRVFVESSLSVEAAYVSSLETDYHAPFEPVSFTGDPEGARTHINDWVLGQTNDRIRDLLPIGSIDGDTRLVLTNAVYFLGTWRDAFDAERTQPLPFFANGGEAIEVPTMQGSRAMRFARIEGATVGELVYNGEHVSMVVVVPEARDGLGALLAGLDEHSFARFTEALAPRPDVTVKLPRFRIEPAASLPLRAPMETLGVHLAFQDGSADLTGIANVTPPLFIANGYHRAFVEVTEEGTEAAAATAVVISTRSMPMEPVVRDELIADHPFFFFLRDIETGLVLFVGHVTDPR
jgi:serpin B